MARRKAKEPAAVAEVEAEPEISAEEARRRVLGDRLRRARIMAGYETLATASAALGIHEVQLCDWERGKRQPGLASLIRLAQGYGRDIIALVVLAPLD